MVEPSRAQKETCTSIDGNNSSTKGLKRCTAAQAFAKADIVVDFLLDVLVTGFDVKQTPETGNEHVRQFPGGREGRLYLAHEKVAQFSPHRLERNRRALRHPEPQPPICLGVAHAYIKIAVHKVKEETGIGWVSGKEY